MNNDQLFYLAKGHKIFNQDLYYFSSIIYLIGFDF